MRFTEAGPIIPNELLDERDAGGVVFLCGAGISIPAGLPDFYKLTLLVCEYLSVTPESEAGRLVEAERERRASGPDGSLREPISFDRIFSQLVKAFGDIQVNEAVVAVLSTVRRPKLANHRALLDLARAPDGNHRLVTTNFDRFFQRARPQLRTYTPPHLPNLSGRDGFDGVVHLHGILPATSDATASTQLGLVLSSGDFGRAYLAEAWATRFMRDLLDRFTVVLLGYSADDPPVRYLLEGLNTSRGTTARHLYAFAAGEDSAVTAHWRDRGVTAIAYNPSNNYCHLWETIHKWADRARDPIAWRTATAVLAQTAPMQLKPYERGQVAALCSSIEGAKGFAEAEPKPPAEWLCVFDVMFRYRKPGRALSYDDSPGVNIDPLDVFGLDDDPPRPPSTAQQLPGVNILAPLEKDQISSREVGIAGGSQWATFPLNSRLFQLSRWIISIMPSATTAWWAAGHRTLHKYLEDQLSWELDRGKAGFHPAVRDAWRLILEAHTTTPNPGIEGWTEVFDRVRVEGWTSRTIRAFAKATRPRVTAELAWGHDPLPPRADEEPTLRRIAHFDVKYPKLIEDLATIPNDCLSTVLQEIRRNLELGAALEAECTSFGGSLPTLWPEDKPGEHHNSDSEEYYVNFAHLFRRLADLDPEAAHREFDSWNPRVRFFLPLRIWVLADRKISTGKEVGRILSTLTLDEFWDSSHSRELLWTLRARWNDLSGRHRSALENRIVAGRAKFKTESAADYRRDKAVLSARWLTWMRKRGLRLSSKTLRQLRSLKAADPDWRDSWTESADASHDSRAGWVKRETDASPIADLPLSKVIPRCDDLATREFGEFVERDPFGGLVTEAPGRALAVLKFEARRGNYPSRYWSSLLGGWPKDARARLTLSMAQTVIRLPASLLTSVSHEVGDWMKADLPKIDRLDRKLFRVCFDHVFAALACDNESLKSGIGASMRGGIELPTNRMGADHAINAPSGDLAEALINVLAARKRKHTANKKIPREIKTRLNKLLELSGEGGAHALTIFAHQLHWFYFIDPEWTRVALLPRFNPELPSAEAAWSGFLWTAQAATPALFAEMKANFLKAFSAAPSWHDDYISHLGAHVVIAVSSSPRHRPLITFEEARDALRNGTEGIRLEALSYLHKEASTKDGWTNVVEPFLRKVWPRERKFQTSATTDAFLRILNDLDAQFPDGVHLLGAHLTSLSHPDSFTYRFDSDRDNGRSDLANKYPFDTLSVVDKIIDEKSERAPYGLAQLLTRLLKAAPDIRQDPRWQRLHRLTLN
jgi:hypothetical protein